ncbi:hypothetical protein HRE53_31165 (plasmid) [Acaryochloris sp. 'Moss Beach']|uniref:hypothetical protein n=1 Tax=Acaryochloris TaxID=155977 RepID=UPI001BAF2188|nr:MULTISPECIES: hypothetical protein [Acaryochloris]QUY45847.1 hypothetical protein I1H34_29350 [Acaryochloris marina S15]UJB73050.1 hypothetical protein HRE53_31165 [Acaryochloris sp. 'Moss Beach']
MNSNQKRTPPNRHLVAFFTFITLLPLVYYVPPWISQNVSSDRLVVTLIAVAVIVPIISYIALPGLFWLLHIIKR